MTKASVAHSDAGRGCCPWLSERPSWLYLYDLSIIAPPRSDLVRLPWTGQWIWGRRNGEPLDLDEAVRVWALPFGRPHVCLDEKRGKPWKP